MDIFSHFNLQEKASGPSSDREKSNVTLTVL
jgi:hypothetical protein